MVVKKYQAAIYTALAIAAAMVLRQIGLYSQSPLDCIVSVLRSGIYTSLFAIWGFSLRRRIVQPQVRQYLTAISVLMIFWLTVRLVRFSFVDEPGVRRYLWYLYYVSMLFIPCLAVLVALSLGKPEGYHLPRWTKLLYIPTTALVLLVLTNDFHQLVFGFPADASAAIWENAYRYGFGYYLVTAWLAGCTVTALVVMILKCRMPDSRKIFVLPFVPVILGVIYTLLYIFYMPILKPLAGDMTVVFCLLTAATLESCIQCGLIQSNTGYDELFLVSRLGAQIADQENRVCLRSQNAWKLTEEQRISAIQQMVSVKNGAEQDIWIKSQPIGFGHVLWQEDVRELTQTIKQYEENCQRLAERNRIRQENLETQKKILTLQEKNRVNDLLQRETAQQISQINQMLKQLDTEKDSAHRRKILAGVAVMGAYIKRYGNLLLTGESRKEADMRDLARCFEDSFINLELLGISCLQTLPAEQLLLTRDMLRIYRSFERIAEAGLYDLSQVWIHARRRQEERLLQMDFVCRRDLSFLASLADAFSYEDGTYRFTFRLQKEEAK